MGRPSKAASTMTGKVGKDEKKRREDAEKNLRGKSEHIKKATMELTKEQKKIRKQIVSECEKVLGNIDRYVVDQCAIAINRLQEIEKMINENPDLIFEKPVISAKKQYFSEFIRLCSELSMTPQSRAKIADNISVKAEENPLRKLFEDEE